MKAVASELMRALEWPSGAVSKWSVIGGHPVTLVVRTERHDPYADELKSVAGGNSEA